MATRYPLTGDLNDLLGGEAKAVYVEILTNLPDGAAVIDSTEQTVNLGAGAVKPGKDGKFSVWLIDTSATDINVEGLQYRVRAEGTVPHFQGGRRKFDSGLFSFTAAADVAELDLDQPTLVASWRGPFVTEMEALRDETTAHRTAVENVVITDLGTTDGQSKTLIETDGTLTRAALLATFVPVLTPEKYGAVGDGITDDTAAVRACFDAANALKRVVGNYYDPGATVLLRGSYKLATLAAPIDATCNITDEGAMFTTPAGYTGVALRVGSMDSGKVLQTAAISLPKIVGSTVANLASLPAGGVGVLIRNLYTSRVSVGNITYFETALKVGGESHGVAYNEITLATMNWYKVGVLLKPLDATGWSNQNTYLAGALTGSSIFSGNRAAGVRAVVLDGTGSNTVTGNTFIGSAFESNVYEYVIEFKNAYQNQFYGCRHEQGVAATSLTVSGDTLTATGHGLTVGNMVIFTATASTPTGMTLLYPYYVVATPTADTFEVSAKKAGTAITFSTAGSGVGFYRPQTVHYDKSWDNTIDKPMTPITWVEQVFTTATPSDIKGNVIRYGHTETVSAHAPATWPVHRARSTQGGAGTKMLWAAYPGTVHPDEDPTGWTAAVSDKGFHFAASGTELGWLSNSGGTLKYQLPADGVVYELASCRRVGAGTTLASSTTYTAGTRTTGTVALSGASVGDYVAWSTTTGLPPRGLTISAQVTSTGTITYAVDNNTGSDITLAAAVTLFFMATRRFF